jgi:hypothetical protein
MDLSPVLSDGKAVGREVYYSQCRESPQQSAMVCDGRWKYCYSQWGGVEELYDQSGDPSELENLAARPDWRKELEHWRGRLIEEARRWGDTAMIGEDGRLKNEPLDRAELAKLPVSGMGWRPY